MLLQQKDDGSVSLHTDTDAYLGTTGEFGILALPQGITSRVYYPGHYHALKHGNDVVDGGPMPWPAGDVALARTDELIQKRRDEKAAAEEEAKTKIQAEVDEINKRIEESNAENEARFLEAEQALIPLQAKRKVGLEKLKAVLQRAGATDQEMREIFEGLWRDK